MMFSTASAIAFVGVIVAILGVCGILLYIKRFLPQRNKKLSLSLNSGKKKI